MDERIRRLAVNLVNYSCRLKPGDKVLIEARGERALPLVAQLIKAAGEAGALPFYRLEHDQVLRQQLLSSSPETFAFEEKRQLQTMEAMDAYIGVRATENALEMSDVPSDRMRVYSNHIVQNVHLKVRVKKTRWVILRWPSASFAQAARMSTEAFSDFFFDTCLLDYAKFSLAMDPLVAMMNRTDRVRITGPGTDLSFSIKEIPAIKCDGQLNIPDGEVFTAPVRDSVNGTVRFNTPTLYEGNFFNGIELTFADGRIGTATCASGDPAKLNEILDRDEGSRYIGEFALGLNPKVTREMLDILFDEKIAGSFHFTPGDSYDEAPNGNKSQIHWDMVCNQNPSHGGGEIWFDGVLIRKDGRFVPESLQGLNAEGF